MKKSAPSSSRRDRKNRYCGVELLEQRRLFVARAWDGGGDNLNWLDPANWSANTLPGPGDDATIAVGFTPFVRLGGAASVRSVNCGVTLFVDGTAAGSLTISNPSSAANFVLSGELTGAGDLNITGLLNWSDGIMSGAGKTSLAAFSVGTINTSTSVTLTREIDIFGTLAIDHGNLSMSTSPVVVGRIENKASGTFKVQTASDISSAGAAIINNAGLFQKTGPGVGHFFGTTGSVSFNSTGTISVESGTLSLDEVTGPLSNNGPCNVFAGAIMLCGNLDGTGSTNVNGGATLLASRIRQNSLTVAGVATIRNNGSSAACSVVNSLSVAGSFDLRDNDLILEYSGGTQVPAVQSLVNSARNGGAWNGPGLTSNTAAAANPANTTLGVMEASEYKSVYGPGASFDGIPIDLTAVVVKYTYYGDTDFSGQVDFDDYVRTDAGYNGGLTGWLNGDSDGSGPVDFDDYVLTDFAYNTQTVTL